MTERTATADLLALAERVAAQAQPGEQVEAYVARGVTTQVKAYGGEVESLTSAESFGVGIRVIADHRQGFAHAGTFDESVVLETLAEARDNASFGEQDEWFGLAEPDGVEPVDQRPLARGAGVVRAAGARSTWPSSSSRRCSGGTPGSPACAPRSTPTRPGRRRWRRAPASPPTAGAPPATCRCSALAEHDGETKIGGGVDVGREPERSRPRGGRAPTRSTRRRGCFGAKPAPSQRLTIVLEPRMAAAIIGIAGGTLTGERVLKGRSPFADRLGRSHRVAAADLRRRPHQPGLAGRREPRRRGPGLPRNELIVDGVLRQFLHNTYTGPPGRRRRRPARPCGATAPPRRRLPGPVDRARVGGRLDELRRRRRARAPRPVDDRLALGRQPGQRRLLGRRRGADDPRRRSWPSRCARSPSRPPCSACCSTSRPSAPTSSGPRAAPDRSPS